MFLIPIKNLNLHSENKNCNSMKIYIVIVLAMLVSLYACKSSGDEKSAISQIENLESLIYGEDLAESAESSDLEKLSELYVSYAQNFAGDDAPEYYFKAAEVEKSLGNYDQALKYFDEIITNYSEHEKTPMSLFYKGFIYENDLEDLNAANKCYTQFANTYPDHELIESVRFSINNLGKPIDQIIYEFDKKNGPRSKPRAADPVKVEDR